MKLSNAEQVVVDILKRRRSAFLMSKCNDQTLGATQIGALYGASGSSCSSVGSSICKRLMAKGLVKQNHKKRYQLV